MTPSHIQDGKQEHESQRKGPDSGKKTLDHQAKVSHELDAKHLVRSLGTSKCAATGIGGSPS